MFKYENGAQWGNARRCSYRIQCTVSGFQYFVDEVLCYRSRSLFALSLILVLPGTL